jgi:hypothetical protein
MQVKYPNDDDFVTASPDQQKLLLTKQNEAFKLSHDFIEKAKAKLQESNDLVQPHEPSDTKFDGQLDPRAKACLDAIKEINAKENAIKTSKENSVREKSTISGKIASLNQKKAQLISEIKSKEGARMSSANNITSSILTKAIGEVKKKNATMSIAFKVFYRSFNSQEIDDAAIAKLKPDSLIDQIKNPNLDLNLPQVSDLKSKVAEAEAEREKMKEDKKVKPVLDILQSLTDCAKMIADEFDNKAQARAADGELGSVFILYR